ncbi:hypothetical protein [Bradyrhizobium genosp. P]
MADVTSGISAYFQQVFRLAKAADTLDRTGIPPWWLGVEMRPRPKP